ncbi:carboxylate-amine ligase [Microbacterium sp. EF45047]|uniref:carboxylate-amine ligase n=1 Tax=Microbacterium sp. EF45047 TaxID=2809708 RepID=UPI00234BD182|nr:YbdK family carboxylate-amine ligase [Microbacterium sp. EF45047]WCM55727.1 YbdK family carboxylate-amine ligase [Microbacterium sp. EF45047]
MPRSVRFGVEEEFVLLDDRTLVPLSAASAQRQVLRAGTPGGSISKEYLTSQLECATDPVATLDEASTQLVELRGTVAAHAARLGAISGPTGTPFTLIGGPDVSVSPHYDEVAALLGGITREHEVNGLHVHVEVPDDEERVRALRRLRVWLPVLLALSTNAPFAYGGPSGFASWRSILIRRLPVSWCPPRFADAEDYHSMVERMVRIGLLPDSSSVSWAVRLSERFDTVEARVTDAQLRVEDTLLLVALIRAIACADGLDDEARHEDLDASLWLAARHGMRARFFTPAGDGIEDAWGAVDRLLAGIRPVLDDLGDAAFVDEHLERLRRDGTGAERQLRAFEAGGVDALADLYRTGVAAGPAKVA